MYENQFIFETEPLSLEWLGEGSPSGTAVSTQRCGTYETSEVQKSNTDGGHLPADFFPGPSGYYLIADFAVGSHAIKNAVRNDANLKNWLGQTLQSAAKDPSVKIKVVGYSDCVNRENRNTKLRADRAKQVVRLIESLLGRDPRWRSLKPRISHGPALVDQYLVDNSTPKNRATNRGVSLELSKKIAIEPLAVSCKADFIHRALNLLQVASRRKVLGPDRSARLLYLVRRMRDKSTDDRYMMEADIDTVARTSFINAKWRRVSLFFDELCAAASRKNIAITDDEVIHGLWRLDNGIRNGICRLVELKQKMPAPTPTNIGKLSSLQALYSAIFKFMADPKSVYFGYRKSALAECKTRSKPVIIRRKPKGKDDPKINTPRVNIPTPTNQTIPGTPPSGGSNWLWESIKGVAKMTGIFIGATIWAIPDPVKERVIKTAWAIFLRGGLPQRALIGLAGEKAAQIVAEWALSKAGIDPNSIFDLNKLIPQGYPGLDLMTPMKSLPGISVKFYAALSEAVGAEREKQAFSRYLSDFVKLTGIGPDNYRTQGYHNMVVQTLRRTLPKIPSGSLPSALTGTVTEAIAKTFIKESTVFMMPDDHVVPFHQYAGGKLLEKYRKFGLPGIPSGLSDIDVAPRISQMLANRFRPLGAKASELRLLLEVADMLPSSRRDTVLRGRRPNWPSQWGPPPTWTRTVGTGP